MNHIFTHTLTGWSLSKVGPISDDLPTALDAIAVARSRPTGDRYELEDTVLRGIGWAEDIGTDAAPLHAQAAQIIADEEAAREAARIAAEANPSVPFAVSRRQLFLALAAIGVTRAAIRAMIEATPDATKREGGLIEFDEAIHFERGHPLIAQLGAALGRSESQIDDLFRSAANL